MTKLYILIVALAGLVLSASAQDKVMDQFKLYAANTSRERVYLHLSQHYAQPGDRVWFNAYVMDDATQRLSDGSKVLYLNVVDSAGDVVMEEKIPLNTGTGEGYLDVPADFKKGLYIVRAYTGWMRNFGVELFFRDFLWVNLQPAQISIAGTNAPRLDELTVNITAEGHGAPVAGLTSRFAVVLKDNSGQGAALEGEVIDETGLALTSFSTNRYGTAQFILRPQADKSYSVVLKGEGGRARFIALPKAQPEGVAILLTTQPGFVRASFQSQWTGDGNHRHRFLLQSKGTVYLDQQLDFDTQPSQALSIPTAQLEPGIYQASLLDDTGKEWAQRVFQIYPDVEEAEVAFEKDRFGRGEKARATFSGDRSMAYSLHISDQLLEGTYEAPGIEEAFFMSDALEADATQMLGFFDKGFKIRENWDLFLLTKKLPPFDWEHIMNYQFAYPRWPYEKYISAYGQVRNAEGLFLGESLFTFYSFAHQEVIPARTDEKGWFLLPVFDFYGANKIVGLSDNKEVSFSGMRIDVESGLPATDLEKKMFSALRLANHTFSDQKRDKLAFKGSYQALVPGLYPEREKTEVAREFSPMTRNTEDYQLDLREYLSFSSLREVFVEIGRGITVRERGGKQAIMLYDPVNATSFAEGALIYINGIPTIDYELVLTLDPDQIETIKLYRSATAQERFGAIGRNGILSIATKDKALEIPNQDNISFGFSGFQPSAEFSNASATQQSHLPDFRHQLYWRTGSDLPDYIECTTSDVLSKYLLRLTGMGEDGTLFSGKATFSTLPDEVAGRE